MEAFPSVSQWCIWPIRCWIVLAKTINFSRAFSHAYLGGIPHLDLWYDRLIVSYVKVEVRDVRVPRWPLDCAWRGKIMRKKAALVGVNHDAEQHEEVKASNENLVFVCGRTWWGLQSLQQPWVRMAHLESNGFIGRSSFAKGYTSLTILQKQSNYPDADPNLVLLTASRSILSESLPSFRFGLGVNPGAQKRSCDT